MPSSFLWRYFIFKKLFLFLLAFIPPCLWGWVSFVGKRSLVQSMVSSPEGRANGTGRSWYKVLGPVLWRRPRLGLLSSASFTIGAAWCGRGQGRGACGGPPTHPPVAVWGWAAFPGPAQQQSGPGEQSNASCFHRSLAHSKHEERKGERGGACSQPLPLACHEIVPTQSRM